MNSTTFFIVALYRCLLALYPAGFRAEFGEEMQETFIQAYEEQQGVYRLAGVCLRELLDLPGAILQQYWDDWLHLFKGGAMITQNEFSTPSSRGEAFLGALPFLAFGLVSMSGRLEIPIHEGYFNLGFYLFVLVGLVIGWAKHFPRWSYAYLSWALVFAWTWTGMRTNGLNLFGHIFTYNESWGWWIWLPLGVVNLTALLWTRSLHPIKQFFVGIWKDWTRLSFGLFVFPAWFSLIYDENHHPYLLLFMLGSTLALFVGAYLYSRGKNAAQRMVSLIGSLVVSLAFVWICDGTWDFATYYHLPPSTEPWYAVVLRWSAVMIVTVVFLSSPGIISLFKRRQGKA